MTSNTWRLTKAAAKLLSDLVIFSVFLSVIRLDFPKLIWVVPLKYLMLFLAGTSTKQFWNICEENFLHH